MDRANIYLTLDGYKAAFSNGGFYVQDTDGYTASTGWALDLASAKFYRVNHPDGTQFTWSATFHPQGIEKGWKVRKGGFLKIRWEEVAARDTVLIGAGDEIYHLVDKAKEAIKQVRTLYPPPLPKDYAE